LPGRGPLPASCTLACSCSVAYIPILDVTRGCFHSFDGHQRTLVPRLTNCWRRNRFGRAEQTGSV
jgi:hypothetical protein